MKCPFCSHDDTQVADSRVSEDGDTIRRRRRCPACDRRFTTYERAELHMPAIVKKDGSRVEFDPAKLRSSMMLALRKRPVAAGAVEEAIARIQEKLVASGEREMLSERIGEWVMRELNALDKVAYIRFASVYQSFEDLDQFAAAIKAMKKPVRDTKKPR